VIENRMLRRIFALARNEVAGSWKKMDDDDDGDDKLHNLNPSSTVGMAVSWRPRLLGIHTG
jgi:hypothetical protein